MLAQQIPFARIDNDADPTLQSFGGREMDKWDGYAYERDAGCGGDGSPPRPARGFSPGRDHRRCPRQLRLGPEIRLGRRRPAPASTARSSSGTSISSIGDEGLFEDGGFTTECGNRNGNAHNHLYDNHRGYVLCDLTPETWESTYRIVSTVTNPGGKVSTLASFVVEQANPGAQINATCTDRTPERRNELSAGPPEPVLGVLRRRVLSFRTERQRSEESGPMH